MFIFPLGSLCFSLQSVPIRVSVVCKSVLQFIVVEFEREKYLYIYWRCIPKLYGNSNSRSNKLSLHLNLNQYLYFIILIVISPTGNIYIFIESCYACFIVAACICIWRCTTKRLVGRIHRQGLGTEVLKQSVCLVLQLYKYLWYCCRLISNCLSTSIN